MTDIERLLVDLYKYCSLLDNDFVDNKPDYDSFSDLLLNIEKNSVVKTKRQISHDLRVILDMFVQNLQSNIHN